jgi:NAD(P)-dependent dehydrogenase (short-subunit alcohol dehydrogenase family)
MELRSKPMSVPHRHLLASERAHEVALSFRFRETPQSMKIALVTGGNRGIGLAVVRELAKIGIHPVLAVRDLEAGLHTEEALRLDGLAASVIHMDVTKDDLVTSGMVLLLNHFKRIDVLVNNAGIFPESRESSFADEDYPNFHHMLQALETNLIGACRMIHAVLPTMLEAGYGRIVNITSDMSFGIDGVKCFSEAGGVAPGYRLAKSALNEFTKLVAQDIGHRNVLINAYSPGQVRTRMGRVGATRSVEDAAKSILSLTQLPVGACSGEIIRHHPFQ